MAKQKKRLSTLIPGWLAGTVDRIHGNGARAKKGRTLTRPLFIEALEDRLAPTVNLADIGAGLDLLATDTASQTQTAQDSASWWQGIGQDQGGAVGILRRVFESGQGAFPLSDIGSVINDTEALRQKLDALDNKPNNVTVTDDGSTVTFDMHVDKTLQGQGAVNYLAQGGLVQLQGNASFSADVHLHVIFGADQNGFFVKADQNPDPEFVVDNVHGAISGTGQIGFLGVQLQNGAIAFDPHVRLEVNVSDPGTSAADGVLRASELSALDAQSISVDLITETEEPNGVADLTIGGTFSVSTFNFPLLSNLNLQVSWANLEDLSAGTISATSGDPESAAAKVLQFLDRDGSEVVNAIETLADQIDSLTGNNFLDAKIPLLNKTLGEILQDGSQALNLAAGALAGTSTIALDGGFKKFTVTLSDSSGAQQGAGRRPGSQLPERRTIRDRHD